MGDAELQFDDELLSAYLDGELTDAERARVEARLEQDPAARQLLAELRDMSAALQAAPRQTLGRDVRAGVWNTVDKSDSDDEPVTIPLDSARPGRIERSRRGLVWAALAIAAAIMLIVDSRDQQRRGERTVAKSSRRESPRESPPTLSASPAPPASVAVESEAVDAARPAAPLATSDGAERGGGLGGAGGGYGAGREVPSAGARVAADRPAAEALRPTDNRGLRSADQMVQLRLAQPRAFVRFQEVLAANSIQVEDQSLADDGENDELAETPAEEDKALMAAAAPDSSPTRGDTLDAAQPQVEAANAAKVDVEVANATPGEALSDLAREASGATAAESEPTVQLGRARLAAKSGDDSISAVLVEATPSQIAAVLDAVRSDSLNFSPQSDESLAEAGQQNAAAPVPAPEQSQVQGRALHFAVPRGFAEQSDQKKLEEVVEGVIERDRAGRQILNQLPRGEIWKMRAINAPADAEAQIRVLFLLDPAPERPGGGP